MTFPCARLLLAGTALAATFAAPSSSRAQAGTTAGTTITNTATATYSVGGTSNAVSSNAAAFVVDRKVNLAVAIDQGANTLVTAGQQGVVARFKVTNATNGTQDFLLVPHQALDFPAGLLPGTDDFDLAGLKAVVDDGDGVYDPTKDTRTYIDELAADASRTVFLVGDIPTLAGVHVAHIALEAIAAAGGAAGTKGAVLVPTDLNVLNQDGEVDVVFADNDNDALGPDIVRNGRGWAYAAFEIGTSSLSISVVKSATIVSDGVNAANFKALPGATVQYCLTVTNGTLLKGATNLNLTDVVPVGTTYVPGSLSVGGIGLAGVCILGGVSVADDGSTTSPYGGSYNAATRTVTATIPTLAGGASVAASFRVTIN